jgi:hypothetical protein
MKQQGQTEQPNPQECKNKAAHDQITIAEYQAQVYPALVDRISLDEPGTIDLPRTFDPGSFEKDGYPALKPGKIEIFRASAKAMIGEQEKQGKQTE